MTGDGIDSGTVTTGAAKRGGADQSLHLSRSLLRAVARQGESVLAGNMSAGSAADVEISIAPGAMAMSAIACPLGQADGDLLDLLYVTLPPQYGTGEWLALASMAAKQYQQAEQTWAARTRDALLLVRGRPAVAVPSSGRDLDAVARLLGYGPGSQGEFLDHYRRATRHARQVVERRFYGWDGGP